MSQATLDTRGWVLEDIRRFVSIYSDGPYCSCTGIPSIRCTDDLDWSFHANLPIRRICGTREQWASWYADERRHWHLDYGNHDRFDSLERRWPASAADDPLVLVLGPDGLLHPNDGCHRIGISHTQHRPTVAAFVGTPRGR